jgi:hypothetical protein
MQVRKEADLAISKRTPISVPARSGTGAAGIRHLTKSRCEKAPRRRGIAAIAHRSASRAKSIEPVTDGADGADGRAH